MDCAWACDYLHACVVSNLIRERAPTIMCSFECTPRALIWVCGGLIDGWMVELVLWLVRDCHVDE